MRPAEIHGAVERRLAFSSRTWCGKIGGRDNKPSDEIAEMLRKAGGPGA